MSKEKDNVCPECGKSFKDDGLRSYRNGQKVCYECAFPITIGTGTTESKQGEKMYLDEEKEAEKYRESMKEGRIEDQPQNQPKSDSDEIREAFEKDFPLPVNGSFKFVDGRYKATGNFIERWNRDMADTLSFRFRIYKSALKSQQSVIDEAVGAMKDLIEWSKKIGGDYQVRNIANKFLKSIEDKKDNKNID